MYERLGQRFRQIMAAQQFLSTIKYVAGTKPSFQLSEIAAYLEEPLTIGQMYAALQPHLDGLGLGAQKTGEDYTISRLLPSLPYILNAAEEKRLEAYLSLTPCLLFLKQPSSSISPEKPVKTGPIRSSSNGSAVQLLPRRMITGNRRTNGRSITQKGMQCSATLRTIFRSTSCRPGTCSHSSPERVC